MRCYRGSTPAKVGSTWRRQTEIGSSSRRTAGALFDGEMHISRGRLGERHHKKDSQMPDYPSTVGPTLVSYQLTSSAYEYIMRVVGLGAFEGPVGDMKLAEDLKPVVDALHTVLAGGSVKLEVASRGSPDIKRELDERMAQMRRDSNEINGKAGYYVTAMS